MSTPLAEMSEADWLGLPAIARPLFLAQQVEIQQLRQENEQLAALTMELAGLRGHL